jgi:nitrate reductase cytochrome c-type subunit
LIDQIGNKTDLITIPKVPQKFNHSNDPNAGQKWNETIGGYNGPWNVASGDNLPACLYCHGNVNATNTSETNITNIVHNVTSLGRVANAFGGNNSVNGTINSTSKWCGACHYPNNPFYQNTTASFSAAGWEIPPDNTNESGAEFFNHSGALLQTAPLDDSDAKCALAGCHGGLLSGGATMDEFAHNVQIGDINDCINCHGVEQSLVPSATINVSAFNSTNVDVDLNPTSVQSANRTLHGDINEDGVTNNSDCILCHYNTTGMGGGYIARLLVNTNVSTADATNVSKFNTYYCTMCHYTNTTTDTADPNYGQVVPTNNVTNVGNPPKVNMHTPYEAARIYTDFTTEINPYSGKVYKGKATFQGGRTPACENCHNNSVFYTNSTGVGGGDSLIKTVVHYGKYYNLTTLGSLDQNTTRCAECHRGDANTIDAERLIWGINDSDGRTGGYVSPDGGNAGTGFDMFQTSDPTDIQYCWTCHIAKNYDKLDAIGPSESPTTHFHAPEVDRFMPNCWTCHGV